MASPSGQAAAQAWLRWWPAPARGLVLAASLLGAVACGTAVPMNEPLPMTGTGQPDFARNHGHERFGLGATEEDGADDGLLVFLAFSGGGKRSAAFAHGVLRGLRHVPVQRPGQPDRRLLDSVDYIAGVSGGSFPAAHYGLFREESFESFPREFLRVDINAYIYGNFLLPWNWRWLFDPTAGTNDRMARVYDALMFRGATFADLSRRGAPLISVNATDIANETSFAFHGTSFGLLCSDLSTFPIARAVAASNGFPVLFGPITLENHAARCGGMAPPTAAGQAPPALPRSAGLRRAELARLAGRYADSERTRWVHLMDGGIADNLALRGLMNLFISLDDHPALLERLARRTRRILVVSVDGQAAPDPALGRSRVIGGLGDIFGAVSSTQIDSFNFETLLLADEQVQHLSQRFAALRCAQGRLVGGFRCDDVKGALVHISLSGIENAADRERLEAIPTGLTIPDADVDALVAYGERLSSQAPEIRAMAAAEPSPPAPTRRRASAPGR